MDYRKGVQMDGYGGIKYLEEIWVKLVKNLEGRERKGKWEVNSKMEIRVYNKFLCFYYRF